jgi:hypothetical protein
MNRNNSFNTIIEIVITTIVIFFRIYDIKTMNDKKENIIHDLFKIKINILQCRL